jgi:hypothetical protein
MEQPTRDFPSALTGATSQLVGPWTNHSCSTRDPIGELMVGKTSIEPASKPASPQTGESVDQIGNRSTSQ